MTPERIAEYATLIRACNAAMDGMGRFCLTATEAEVRWFAGGGLPPDVAADAVALISTCRDFAASAIAASRTDPEELTATLLDDLAELRTAGPQSAPNEGGSR